MSATFARPVTSEPEVVEAYFAQVRSYEHDRLKSARRVAGLAWTVAIGAALVAGAALFATARLALRPMPDPIVFRVDSATGIPERIYDVVGGDMAATEANTRYWLWRFVRLAEGYSSTDALPNFEEMALMSVPDVQRWQFERTKGSNTLSPQVVLGPTGRSTVTWRSADIEGNRARIHFKQVDRKGDFEFSPKYMVATITFAFAPKTISWTVINVNPLGFLVTSYHVDQESPQ